MPDCLPAITVHPIRSGCCSYHTPPWALTLTGDTQPPRPPCPHRCPSHSATPVRSLPWSRPTQKTSRKIPHSTRVQITEFHGYAGPAPSILTGPSQYLADRGKPGHHRSLQFWGFSQMCHFLLFYMVQHRLGSVFFDLTLGWFAGLTQKRSAPDALLPRPAGSRCPPDFPGNYPF